MRIRISPSGAGHSRKTWTAAVMDQITLDRDWFSWFRADPAAQTGSLCFQERFSLLPLTSVAFFPLPPPREVFLGPNANRFPAPGSGNRGCCMGRSGEAGAKNHKWFVWTPPSNCWVWALRLEIHHLAPKRATPVFHVP